MGNKLERLYTPVVNIWSGATPLPTVAGSFFVHFSRDNSLRRTVVMVLPFFFYFNHTLPLYKMDTTSYWQPCKYSTFILYVSSSITYNICLGKLLTLKQENII